MSELQPVQPFGFWSRLLTSDTKSWLLLLPTMLLLLLVFVGPFLILLVYSVFGYVPGGGVSHTLTHENYQRFLTDPFSWSILFRSLRLALIVTAICVVFGLPVAYTIARTKGNVARALLYAMLLVPLMASVVVRSYGWIILLGSSGVINYVLTAFGFSPSSLLYTMHGTTIALSAVLLPFMIIILVPVMQSIDENLELAAQSLGATSIRTFFGIVFPMAKMGLIAGSVIVFVLAIGSFATPILVGGTMQLVMPGYIYQQALGQVMNWPFGSAIAIILLVVVFLLIALQALVFRRVRR